MMEGEGWRRNISGGEGGEISGRHPLHVKGGERHDGVHLDALLI